MAERTPTTELIRQVWADYHSPEFLPAFDRWLAQERAKSWDEGYIAGYRDRRKERDYDPGQNPYQATIRVEPPYPISCENCGRSYDACTHRILDGFTACCSECAYTVTHNQNEWEKWNREQRNKETE